MDLGISPVSPIKDDDLLVININSCHLHVTVAGVILTHVWSAKGECPSDKFTTKEVLKYTAISHSMDVTKP